MTVFVVLLAILALASLYVLLTYGRRQKTLRAKLHERTEKLTAEGTEIAGELIFVNPSATEGILFLIDASDRLFRIGNAAEETFRDIPFEEFLHAELWRDGVRVDNLRPEDELPDLDELFPRGIQRIGGPAAKKKKHISSLSVILRLRNAEDPEIRLVSARTRVSEPACTWAEDFAAGLMTALREYETADLSEDPKEKA